MSPRIFCPRCATENGTEQKYCRQCGQSLFGIQWVLDGNLTEVQRRLEAGEKWAGVGNSILITFISIAVTIAGLDVALGIHVLSAIAMANVLVGALIGLPFVFVGYSKVSKAKRLMSEAEANQHPAIQGHTEKQLPAAETAELPPTHGRPSITEHTTVHVTRPERQSN